jgi:non-heme chloroperoxidase
MGNRDVYSITNFTPGVSLPGGENGQKHTTPATARSPAARCRGTGPDRVTFTTPGPGDVGLYCVPVSSPQVSYMRSNVVFGWSAVALLSLATVAGCSDDDGPPPTPPDASQRDGGPPDDGGPSDGSPDATPPDAGPPPVDYPKQTVTLSTGIDMQYVEVGDLAGTETVIMLHGFTDSSRSFFPTIEALNAIDPALRIYALDLRGHGGSSMPGDVGCDTSPAGCFELSDFADDVFAFLDEKNINTAHFVGHSLGSLVAQELAITDPGTVESLVLISSSANTTGNPVFEETILDETILGTWQTALEQDSEFGDWPEDAYELTPIDADPNAETWVRMSWVVDPTANPAFIDKLAPEAARVKIGTWLGVSGMLLTNNSSVRLRNLAVDAVILWGTQDVLFRQDDQDELLMSLDAAVTACRAGYIWKPYGKVPLPVSGQQVSDLGRSPHWGAPAQVAADIRAVITTGKPTDELYFANPSRLTEILSEPAGDAIIEKPAETNCR